MMTSCIDVIIVSLILLSLTSIAFSFQRMLVNESEYWDINTQKGIIRGQNLRLRKLNHPTNPYHTCYEITCEGRQCIGRKDGTVTIQVCYPLFVVTGLPKCGTSAMYELLSKFPGAIVMHEKENCPSTRRRPHWIYFLTLPRMSDLNEQSVIIDGCISVVNNMKIRELILNPNTFYLVMIRDYTDMLWSSYNFWCKREYDGEYCDYSKWANADHHIRSPSLFHDLISLDANHTSGVIQPFYYPMERPCINAGGYYTEYLTLHLYNRGLQNYTVVIASEELDTHPQRVAERVAAVIGYNITGMDLTAFQQVRVNTQEAKGTTHVINSDLYKPGLYNISHYEPVHSESRDLLNKCWLEDCRALAAIPPYYHYAACFPDLVSQTGDQSHQAPPIIVVDRQFIRAGRVFVPVS